MTNGTLIEFGGLPGTGKSTLAAHLADRSGAVWLRIDEIEGAMRRNGLTADQTGVAAYSVAHDVAASHLRRGLTVIADAVNPVDAARRGWRDLARSVRARHVVIETTCPDLARLDRIAEREADVLVPLTPDAYERRTDERLIVDTTLPLSECQAEVVRHTGLTP
ncbi:AAA family ATPase [Actinoplanes sp. NPDC004185]